MKRFIIHMLIFICVGIIATQSQMESRLSLILFILMGALSANSYSRGFDEATNFIHKLVEEEAKKLKKKIKESDNGRG